LRSALRAIDWHAPLQQTKKSTVKKIGRAAKTKTAFTLNKSYRSTVEINDFAGKFRDLDETRMMERHGEKPQIVPFFNPVEQIKQTIAAYRSRGHKTNMILCRTQKECDELYRQLMHEIPVIRMRSFDTFTPGTTVILPVYLSKGLEADGVIIAGVSDEWNTQEDRNLMYVAATRPLHELTVFTNGNDTKILS
jgi:DNA helicase-2/ATP-dependent DNA helicase PcrA